MKINKLKIGTFNVNSLCVRELHVLEILETHGPDVFFLQELKCEEKNIPDSFRKHQEYEIFYHCQKGYNGSAILIKKSILLGKKPKERKFFDEDLKMKARYIEIEVLINNEIFLFASVYAPNGSEIGSEKFEFKTMFFASFQKYLQDLQMKNAKIIIGGDYNIAPYEKDLSNSKECGNSIGFSKTERQMIREIFDLGFYDSYRLIHPEKNEYSWFDYRGHAFQRNEGMRIDYILVDAGLANFVSDAYIEDKWRCLERPSDHLPVFTELNI